MLLHLDQQFKPIDGQEITFESFTFNGGEPHIRIHDFDTAEEVYITHRIRSFNDLGLLCIAIDALKRMGATSIHVLLPYFPAARQDRVMVPGESLTVKVIANIINGLGIQSITIFDPHSDVAPAVLDNCKVITNLEFIKLVLHQLPMDTILISPDAGASKKIFQLAKELGIETVIECRKNRNVLTGELTGFTVPIDNLENKPCLVVDDICDGGGTFMGIGEALKKRNAGDLFLAVSHGIFSKGFDNLNSIFSKIFTTDSFKTIDHPNISQIKLHQLINQSL